MSPPDSNPPGRETAEAAWPSPPLGAGLEPSFKSAIEKGAPAAIWALGDATALWWNEAGAVLFELPEAKDAPPPVRAALSRAAGSDRPWLERWRLVLQRRAMLATLLLGRARLDDGTEGLIIAATEVAPPIASNEHATPPAPLVARASEERIETSERKSTRADDGQPHTLPSGATTAHASSRRLTWQTDASGRLLAGPPGTSLSQALGRGAPMQPALLSELFAKGGPSVEEAIASGRPVSGVPVETIPAPDGSSLIGVLFGAPVLDQGRKAAGHRGFFVVSEMRPAPPQASSSETSSHEARSLPQLSTPAALEEGVPGVGVTPPVEAAAAPSADELGDLAVSEEVVETAEASALGSSAGPTPPLGDEAGQLLAVGAQILSPGQGDALAPEPNEAGFRASNVISLRKPGAEPARPSEKEAAPELSPAERDAFADIAKALGAAWPAQNVQREKSASTSRPDEKAEKAGELPEKPPGEDRAAEAGQAETPSQPRGFPEASVDDLSTLIDRLPIGILVHRSGAALAANKTLLDLLGHESFEAFEASGGIEELFAEPNPKAGARKHVAITARDGQIVEVDARCQAIKWRGEAATLLSLRRSLHGETQSLEAAGHRSAVAAKDAEVGEWRALVDLATDGVVTIDELGRVVAMSASAEKLFGYAAKEISGEALAVLIAPDCHRSLAAELEEARGAASKAATREPHEITGRTREGRRISLSMRLQAGKPREGQLSAPSRRWHAIFRDLTANKDSEAGLVEARVAAERMTAQKSEFLAKVSHEIRTPLNSIVGFADIIAEERFGPLENERYKEYIKDIRASGTHIISLVNDLLDLSKIESGRMELSLAPVNLNAEVAAGVALVQMDAARSRVLMRQSLAQGLPSVIADARSVKQILLNILSNAVKFTEPGGQVIVSTALTEKGEVIFRARDTGIGMSERELAEALEPFKQFATALRPGGSGLGLSLTKALVKANQANLSIASRANEGTLVEVVFPRTRVLAA
ncbi:MAG: PAS domain-containing protein [Hyphomicrobiales bacterium]|nr:PAS domain-containing protein [Hyphomicrobiales bacterium]